MNFSDYYHMETNSLIRDAHYVADILTGEQSYSWGNGFALQTAEDHKLACIGLLVDYAHQLTDRRTMCPALSDKLDVVAKTIYEQILRDEGIVDFLERQQAQFPWMKALLETVLAIADHGNIDRVCRYWIPFMSLLAQDVRILKHSILENCSTLFDRHACGDGGEGSNHLLTTLLLAIDVGNAAAAVGDHALEEVIGLWLSKAFAGNQPDWVHDVVQRHDISDEQTMVDGDNRMHPVVSIPVRKALLDIAKTDPAYTVRPALFTTRAKPTLKVVR